MRTRDKVRIVQRFKEGAQSLELAQDAWFAGKILGRLDQANRVVESTIREAMNGAPWWPPKKGGKK